MRLTLTVHALSGGGAEKVLASLASEWATRGHDVTVVTLDDAAQDRWTLGANVQRVSLGESRPSRSVWQAVCNNRRRIAWLRRSIVESKPDRVVSFLDRMNVTALLACRGLGIPVIIAERTDPRRHTIGRIWEWLRRRTYPRCAALVVQTERVRRACRSFAGNAPIYVIPNSVAEIQTFALGKREPDASFRIVAAGRLGREKGFDRLIAAFHAIASQFPGWQVDIFGEGPERSALQWQIDSLKLTGQVVLHGWVSEISPHFAAADLFVLPSRYEGFPNALLEAMSAGVPSIAFNCESGPAEIIRHGQNGWLVAADDVAELAAAMQTLMSQPALRQTLGHAARDVTRQFSPACILSLWDAALTLPREAEFDRLRLDAADRETGPRGAE